jgi:hypothetical protein
VIGGCGLKSEFIATYIKVMNEGGEKAADKAVSNQMAI